MYSTIIACGQLVGHLEDKDWLILDCRFNLADTGYGHAEYQKEHISNAHYLHLDNDLSSPITPGSGRHPLPIVDKLEKKLQEIGLRSQSQVVVYDDCGGAMAARAWWLLRWMGHNTVAVLDGGFSAWKERAHPLSNKMKPNNRGDFIAKVNNDFVITTEYIINHPAAIKIVDARSSERFCGRIEPIDPVSGHIPNAINRPLTDNLESGCFKSPVLLKQEWEKLLSGITSSQVVHMCGSGVTACHNLLAMEMAGLKGSRLYAGSWSEWISDKNRPIAVC